MLFSKAKGEAERLTIISAPFLAKTDIGEKGAFSSQLSSQRRTPIFTDCPPMESGIGHSKSFTETASSLATSYKFVK